LLAGPLQVVPSKVATGNVLFSGPLVLQEWQFEASHFPVQVTAGECYWIEIQNRTTGICSWLWSTTSQGDGRSAQDSGSGYAATDFDLAFCVDLDIDPFGCIPPRPTEDDCAAALTISGEGIFPFDNSLATQDGPLHAACHAFGSFAIDQDVWYRWLAPCDGTVAVETCGLTSIDTKLAIYDAGSCPPKDDQLLDCSDDDCGAQSRLLFAAVGGQEYFLRVGSAPGSPGGSGEFQISCLTSVPDNDLCDKAIALQLPAQISGTTLGATLDENAPFCETAVTTAGVWYRVQGDGNQLTAELCNGTSFDAKLSVYCGDCPDGLQCVAGNDDTCGLQSQVSWCSQSGSDYLLLVHGFAGATGDFGLLVYSDGAPCALRVVCSPLQEALDVRPGECPNRLAKNSDGDLRVALLGSLTLDVQRVEPTSLRLTRSDGVGGAVTPLLGPAGPSLSVEDLAAPFSGRHECACEPTRSDGYLDLAMSFSSGEVLQVLQLSGMPDFTDVSLTLDGTLQDGSPWQARDCLRLLPPYPGIPALQVDSNEPDLIIDLRPADRHGQSGGSTPMRRYFSRGQTVQLKAPANHNGASFLGWLVDGALHSRSPQISLQLERPKLVEARYRSPRLPRPLR
jgi:hypothetical protein